MIMNLNKIFNLRHVSIVSTTSSIYDTGTW
jgi:hypothetical protein